MKYTLVIPTLNEIDGVREIMPEIRGEWYDRIPIYLDMIARRFGSETAEYIWEMSSCKLMRK
jgi:hypothetical protein